MYGSMDGVMMCIMALNRVAELCPAKNTLAIDGLFAYELRHPKSWRLFGLSWHTIKSRVSAKPPAFILVE